MNVEEQLKTKTEQLKKVGEEITQLQRMVTENREAINQKTGEALKLDGAVTVLKELKDK